MIRTVFSSLALALVAFSANALVAPRAAHADACSDLAAIVQNPQGGTGGEAAAASIRARAQALQQKLCPGGAAADASAPTNTPAQLAAATIPSSCPAYSDPPQPAAGATRAQIRSSIATFNSWATASNTSMACHNTEIVKAQRDAAVYDAAALVWQQRFVAQITDLQATFTRLQPPAQPAEERHHGPDHREQ